MNIDKNLFIHDMDRAALNALESVPGFPQFIKAMMAIYNENVMKITNMSSNLRVSEEQLPEYHEMLVSICQKLGIPVPELYISMDVNPNAYTSGDTSPFIVITSGLLDTLPDELIPTVIAHECGHIICHHVLYSTFGRLILSGAFDILKLPNIAKVPIEAAFSYWMRCSEFSADRAAIVCDGTAEKMARVCAYFGGYNKNMDKPLNMSAFINQAKEYRAMIKGNAWNKTLETIAFLNNSHPLNAVRAAEAIDWEKTEQFRNVCILVDGNVRSQEERKITNNTIDKTAELQEEPKITNSPMIRMKTNSLGYTGRTYLEVSNELKTYGFNNISLHPVVAGNQNEERNIYRVSNIKISGVQNFNKGDTFAIDSTVDIYYLVRS